MKHPVTIGLAALLSTLLIVTPCLAEPASEVAKQACTTNTDCSKQASSTDDSSKTQDKELAVVSSGFLALLVALSGAGVEAK